MMMDIILQLNVHLQKVCVDVLIRRLEYQLALEVLNPESLKHMPQKWIANVLEIITKVSNRAV